MSACALPYTDRYNVTWVGEEPPAHPGLSERLPLTVALSTQAFDAKFIKEDGFLEQLAGRLKDSKIFQGVIYPVPADYKAVWELKLLVHDRVDEPNSNFWKAALAQMLLPLSFFTFVQSDYTLEIEALLTRRREVVASYPVKGLTRNYYQVNTNQQLLNRDVIELMFDRTSRQLLAAIAADAAHINSEDRARMGK